MKGDGYYDLGDECHPKKIHGLRVLFHLLRSCMFEPI